MVRSSPRRPQGVRAQPGRVRRLLGRLLALTLLLALAVGGRALFAALNAPVEVVRVEGNLPEAGQARIRTLLGEALPAGVLTLDVVALQARLAEESWVASASLRREWPDTLRVQVTPEVPVARWRDEALLSNRGRIIDPLWDNVEGVLPSLAGPEGSAAQLMATYLRVAEMLKSHQLTVQRLEESAAGDIEVTLKGGVRLRLGTDAQVARLRRVDAVLTAALGTQLDRVDSIDARYDNGVAVAWRDGTAGAQVLALRDLTSGKGR
ncbi:MAG: Cell division protein FtsQ [Pseudomonadota bacterium]